MDKKAVKQVEQWEAVLWSDLTKQLS